MALRRVISLILLMALLSCLGAIEAGAKQKQSDEGPLPPNEIQGKAPSNYLTLKRMHVPVVVDKNQRFRSLEVEVWLLPLDEANMARARSAKKAIIAGVEDDFANYDWEVFEDSERGPAMAKKIVAGAVERVSGAKLQDVLIKTLVIH